MNLKPLFDLLDAQHDSGNQDQYFHEMKHYLTPPGFRDRPLSLNEGMKSGE